MALNWSMGVRRSAGPGAAEETRDEIFYDCPSKGQSVELGLCHRRCGGRSQGSTRTCRFCVEFQRLSLGKHIIEKDFQELVCYRAHQPRPERSHLAGDIDNGNAGELASF